MSPNEVSQFLDGHHCVIAEPSPAFSSNIQACLIELGVLSKNIITVRRFEDAILVLRKVKAKLLVTEYSFEKNFGLELVEMQKKIFGAEEHVSIIITKDSSDSAVAEAAEEQVDAFILKPFSTGMFHDKLVSAIGSKLYPSPYTQRLNIGKGFLEAKDYINARQEFVAAKALHKKPSLACYYAGRAHQYESNEKLALSEYKEGRQHQPLHYQCLLGELELLIETRQFDEAYKIVPIIKDNFPITPLRLGQIFIATVFSSNFDAVGENYEALLKLDRRPEELTRIAITSMLAGGKHFLKNGRIPNSVDLFEKAILISGRDFSLIEKIIRELLNAGYAGQARYILGKASGNLVGTPKHIQLSFKVDCMLDPVDTIIERGRKLIANGHSDPEIYRKMVQILATENKNTLAESIIARAVSEYPDLRSVLFAILEKRSTKSA